jgi:hypothetical protein
VVQFDQSLSLSELLTYDAVLVFTGDDQEWHSAPGAIDTLDRLEAYVRKGGRLIVAGQGPWRDSPNRRLVEMLGISTHSGRPLLDPGTEGPIELDSYLVFPTDGPVPLTLPVDIDPKGDGRGDLTLVGELSATWGVGLPDLWTEPFLTMPGDQFQTGGNLGILFDPYKGYGVYSEAEALSCRVAFMGFGFERVNNLVPDTTSRQALFEAVYNWVTDEIYIDVDVFIDGLNVTLVVEIDDGSIDTFKYDFGDETTPVTSDHYRILHRYDSYGEKDVTVLARSTLGTATIERFSVDLVEPDADTDSSEPDASVPPDEAIAAQPRDCQCRATGARPKSGLLGILLRKE